MAGQLVQVATETVTSDVGYVNLIGTTTDDVYMVAISNLRGANDNAIPYLKILVGGSVDTSSSFRRTNVEMKAYTSFVYNGYNAGQNFMYFTSGGTGTATGETAEGLIYLYNFNNSSEYNFGTIEAVTHTAQAQTESWTGGFVHNIAQSSNGIQILMSAGNIASGTFTMYRVV